MITMLFGDSIGQYAVYGAAILAFVVNLVLIYKLKDKLPTDIGRAYAVNAAASKGKPRGAGFIFVLVFAVLVLLVVLFSWENAAYLGLMILAMLAGFLDDASRNPWGEYKKGFIDLLIAFFITLIFVMNNSTTIWLPYTQTTVGLPSWLYLILGTLLVWVSVNVTNCTDGVDGLSSTLSLISMGAFIVLLNKLSLTDLKVMGIENGDFRPWIFIFMGCVAAYLMLNVSPSILMMGDAGSRSIGVFFALVSMKSGAPLMYIPLCLVFILDGGLGLIKVSLLRFLKIKILANVRTPLHDHARKNKHWSDAATVTRFALLHLLVVFAALYLIK